MRPPTAGVLGAVARRRCSGTTTTSTTSSDGIAAILRKPLIGAVAARLAQADEIRIFQSTLIYKPPIVRRAEQHRALALRQALLVVVARRRRCSPRSSRSTTAARRWAPSPWSTAAHRWQEIGADDTMVRHFAERDRNELEEMLAENAAYNSAEVRKIPMVIPKGHMSFHHCRTYHGSGANRQRPPRRAISLHLQDGDERYREFRALRRRRLAAYNHDVLVRRTADGRPDYADPDYCPVIWRRTANPAGRLTCPGTTGVRRTRASSGWSRRSTDAPRRGGQAPALRQPGHPRRSGHLHGAPRLRRLGLHVPAEVVAAAT